MLAYVFWHWTDTADIADYEKRLAAAASRASDFRLPDAPRLVRS